MTLRNITTTWALGCFLAGSSYAQYVISAKSGLIHYTEGKVFLADNPVTQKVGEYPDIKAGQHLRTDEGRAEVLLTPGVFLRLSENSEIAMISNALTNTRLEVVKGGVVIEAGEVLKEHAIELLVGGSELELRKRGVFRIDASTPPRIRVYDGEISVVDKGKPLTVKEGRQVLLTSVPVPEKFSKEARMHSTGGLAAGPAILLPRICLPHTTCTRTISPGRPRDGISIPTSACLRTSRFTADIEMPGTRPTMRPLRSIGKCLTSIVGPRV